jgi:hypothetical protein
LLKTSEKYAFLKIKGNKNSNLIERCKNTTTKFFINSKYMIDFDKIDDLSFMIQDFDSKKLKRIKKHGKKSINQRKRIKKRS